VRGAAVSEGAVTALGGDGPLADCRYTVVIPSRHNLSTIDHRPVDDLAAALPILEEHPHGWVYDRAAGPMGKRLQLEDLR